MIGAVTDELHEARSATASRLRVVRGRQLHAIADRFLYQFDTDVPTSPLPAESPVMLVADGGTASKGSLVAIEEYQVLVELRDDIGPSVPQAELRAEAWHVLEKLGDRLQSLRTDEAGVRDLRSASILPALLGQAHPRTAGEPVAAASPDLNAEQYEAVHACTSRSLHFVWGPPGTGKTATLAETASALALRGERILVVAHSNVAVDVAIARIADRMASSALLRDGAILRIGTPQLPELTRRSEVLPEGVLHRDWPELFSTRDDLLIERRETWKALGRSRDADIRTNLTRRLEEVRKRLQEIDTRVKELTVELIGKARIIGATLSRLVIDETLWALATDATIVDEVSMATFAQVFAAGSRANTRLLLFGDARQLPPIHLATTRASEMWLGRDAFEVAGLSDAPDDTRVSFLSTQYRMGPDIANVVSKLAYRGRLVTSEATVRRARELSALAPAPGREFVIVDTSSLRGASFRETRRGSYSRVNPVHLALGVSVAAALHDQGCRDLSVISPYRAQAHLAGRALRELIEAGHARAATVHRFQGSESEAVIVDLVDAPPQRGASQLTGADEDTALRLLNVALSRARGKLVVLADVPFITNRHLPGSPARRLLELAGSEALISPTSIIDQAPGLTQWFADWPSAQEALAADLLVGARSIVGHLPAGFEPGAAIVEALMASKASRKLIFATIRIANMLEATDSDLRLTPRQCGLVLIASPVAAWIAGTDPNGPIARLAGNQITEAMQEALFADALLLPAPSAEAEELLARACGRCHACGKPRRPRHDPGGWSLRCSTPGHPGMKLGLAELTELANAAGATCGDCGGPAVARNGRNRPFLGCEGYGSRCEGKPPDLEELFAPNRSK